MFIQQVIRRHMHIIRKRELSKDFIVADLAEDSLEIKKSVDLFSEMRDPIKVPSASLSTGQHSSSQSILRRFSNMKSGSLDENMQTMFSPLSCNDSEHDTISNTSEDSNNDVSSSTSSSFKSSFPSSSGGGRVELMDRSLVTHYPPQYSLTGPMEISHEDSDDFSALSINEDLNSNIHSPLLSSAQRQHLTKLGLL